METALLVAFIAVGITAISSVVDFIQTWHIRKVQNKLNEVSGQWQEQGGIGEQFGEYLLSRETPDAPSNLQIMAVQVGSQIAASIKGSFMGVQSGESRHLKQIEGKVISALEPDAPEMKLAQEVMNRIGLPADELPAVLAVLQKYGYLAQGKLPQNNGGRQASW